MKNILVIDDEQVIVDTISIILEDMGINVTGAINADDGIKLALDNDYDLILTDIRMPEKSGADVAKEVISNKPHARVLIITAYPSDPLAKEALEAGAISLLKKPFEISKILDYLQES